ncbi:MAG: hypothetical protein FP820_07315 [Sulfurimonas sp.]|jgi:hypothetical protein|nr:hypothetical protein [Sulfurimonas sp.]MBU1216745.1 hypothetical protein [bacterium]MBU1434872.1 hypothetical protein [bacterium]MBU1503977.1 hypothetical protein [bacterium]MBU3938676.1 hypothetical protein [bacterium]
MSKRIGLHIGGRRFDVDVEDGFSVYLQAQMTKDFNIDGNNDLKLLLQAYVRKNHELFLQEQKLQEVLKKIGSEL